MSKIVRRGLHLLIISAITAIFGVLTVFGVSAEVGDTFTVNTIEGAPITYRVTSDAFQTVEVCDCQQDYSGIVTLPEGVENPNNNMSYAVTSIEYHAFDGCQNLKSVILGESITSIGEGAFVGCVRLTSITIPESVTSIGDYAFGACFSLRSVAIPESVTSIGECAFISCESLSKVYCDGLEPPSLGDHVFDNYYDTDFKIYIPEGTKDAYIAAGWPRRSLTFNTFTNTFTVNTVGGAPITYRVTSEGEFSEAEVVECPKNYKGAVTLPESVIDPYNNLEYSVTSIETHAFAHCKKLTSITIPNSVTSIGDYAVYYCTSLSKVYCDGLEPPSLGNGAFTRCASNLEIYIPEGTKDAYVDAGWPKDNLVEIVKSVKVVDGSGNPIESAKVTIYLKEYTPFALTKGYTNSEGIYTCPVDIPCDTIEVKKSGYKKVETRVSDNFELVVVMEGSSEFTCKTVEGADITYRITSDKTVELLECGQGHKGAVTLPESVINPYNNLEYSVTSIGDYAFWSCYDLTSITIPNSVTSIGEYAVYYCTNLSKVYCDGLEPPSLGNGAFTRCASNLEIYIPNGTKDAYVVAGWPEDNLVCPSIVVL